MRVLLGVIVLFLAYSGVAKADWVPVDGYEGFSSQSHELSVISRDQSASLLRDFFQKRDKLIEAIDFYEYQEIKGRVFMDFDGNIVSSLLRNDLLELEQSFDRVRPDWRRISKARDDIKNQMLSLEKFKVVDGETFADPETSIIREHLAKKLSGLFE